MKLGFLAVTCAFVVTACSGNSPDKSTETAATESPTPSAVEAAAPAASESSAQTTAALTPPASFARCAVCHNATKGGANKIGPNLWGVYGAKAGVGDFAFSDALKASNITWDDSTLDTWLQGPQKMVPGVAMVFPPLNDAAKRAEIIAYLKQSR